MDDDVQQYERHALPAYNRDRLCVSFRLLSPLNVQVTRESSLRGAADVSPSEDTFGHGRQFSIRLCDTPLGSWPQGSGLRL